MAASETKDRDGSLRLARAVALPFVLYLLLVAAAAFVAPYRPALDDAELQTLARYWAEHGRLDADPAIFLRVPLWQMLLGSVEGLLGERAGVLSIQAALVLASLWTFARRCEREGRSGGAVLAAAMIFAVAPQVVLYSRHTVNELFIGWLAMLVVVLGERVDERRALALGAITGAALMTKVAAVALVLPAAVYLWRARTRLPLGRSAPRALLGFAVVALPLAALAVLQRGSFLLDNTSAFNLSALDQQQWLALADGAARQQAGMQSFWQSLGSDPAGYLLAVVSSAVDWILRPGSLDILQWLDGYPALLVEVADVLAFFGLATLAAFAMSRATAPVWLFPLAMWLACSLPQKTPYSPRISVLFPLLLLAPAGIEALRGLRSSRPAGVEP